MLEFLETCLSFPVNIFSGLLIIACLYWLVAAFGLVDMDSLDVDTDADVDLEGGAEGLAGLLFHLGLHGVPMTLMLTFIALFGWLISYYAVHWVLGALLEPGLLRYALGGLLFLGSLFVAALLTGQVIKPLRRFFRKEQQITGASLCGRTVAVRSSQVTATYGEAECPNAGSVLLLEIRPLHEGAVYTKGDKVVLVEYDPETRQYSVTSEEEFLGFPRR